MEWAICRLEEKLEARITEVEEPQKVKERTGGDGGAKRMEQNGRLSQMEKALKQREIEMKEMKERLDKDARKPGKRGAHGK